MFPHTGWPEVHEFAWKCNLQIMLSAHKLSQTCKTPILGCFVYGMTCARVTCSVDYLWGELMKIGTTCARTTCVLGLLVTGSLWTLGRLVRGQHVIWDYLSQGGHEHWGELSKGTVLQGQFKVVSLKWRILKRDKIKDLVGERASAWIWSEVF
jgi:hypothetical protein